MNNTNMPVLVSHSGCSLLSVAPLLLLFSLGFVLGMISNANFPNFYLPPFLPTLPSPARSSTPPSPTPERPCIGPPLPSPTPSSTQTPPPPSSPERPIMGVMGFLAPSGVMHNMTDEELLWRASMAPRVSRTPFRRVPKVAFLFLVRGELPLRPLWEKFFAGHQALYSIYVHTDPSYAGSPPKDSVFYGRMIPSKIFSLTLSQLSYPRLRLINLLDRVLVEAERRLLANALLDLSNERFALLSESCIPIFDFPNVYAHLTGANTSFVDCFDDRSGRFRYNPFFAGHNITLAQWRKGSQWFEMDRALALEVVSDETYFPVFRSFCDEHRGCIIDEHYIPTLVNLLGWKRRNADRTLTYTDWGQGTPHPRTHGGKDVTEDLFKRMRGGAGAGANCSYNGGVSEICFVFARKFSPDALGALLELAPKVMGFG